MNRLDQGDRINELFKSSIEFGNGHYTVGLPWKTDTLMLPDNFVPSKYKLELLVKRLNHQPMFLQKHDDIIKKQEKTGIVEPVNILKLTSWWSSLYISQRIVREDRATTKVRIVYDARANKNGPSLNEMLETGPCIVFKVFEILLRAIRHKFLLVSDTQSAFLNIGRNLWNIYLSS